MTATAPTHGSPAHTTGKHRILRWCLSLLLTALLIAGVETALGWRQTLSAWSGVPLSTLLMLAVATLVSYALRAWRAYLYFGRHRGHPFLAYLRINLLHNALNNLLPMRLGEASFPLLMKHRFELPVLSTAAGLAWIRLMDLHWLGLLLSLLGIRLIGPIMMLPALLLPTLPFILMRFSASITRWLPGPLKSLARMLAEHGPLSPALGLKLYLLTALLWSLKLFVLMLVIQHFIDIPGVQGLLAIIFADLSSVLPIHGLAGAGTFEGAMLAALLPFGVAAEAILLAAVNLHLYMLGVTLVSIPVALMLPECATRTRLSGKLGIITETKS
ncbi:MAG: UPF0104 family protein [Oceanospirillales bacterium]|nr:UPF0104 family protein [Oceanospirillales bacterium]